MTDYFAHSGNDHGRWHLLKQHLTSVANLAREYSSHWKGQDEAYLAGLLHDLGNTVTAFNSVCMGSGLLPKRLILLIWMPRIKQNYSSS